MPYEEVVIDGDTSTDEEAADAVLVVTPQSRKRRRQSAIHDDEDEGVTGSSQTAPPVGGPHAPLPTDQQKEEEEDDDDDVEIIQVSTPSSAEAKRRKAKRLTIVDSDEEEKEEASTHRESAVAPVRRLAASDAEATPQRARDREATSSGRRSSRIEKKRQEKAAAGPSARKLEFLSLENCLDQPSLSRREATHEDDDDEFIVDDDEDPNDDDATEEEEEDEAPSRRRATQKRKRARSPPPRPFASGDDDMDEFIVDDDEVEYMDDDEEGVMDQPLSSAEEEDDGENLRATMQSREPLEWFSIYLRYLEECILDEDLDNKIRTNRRNTDYRVLEQAVHHIERALCSRRDALRSSVVWNDEIMDNLHCATKFHSIRCTATTDCQACRRANHYATQLVQFGGFACDSTELYRGNWMKKLRSAVRELEPMRASFELGTVCHARTLGYWQLLHAKHFWVALVDAKRRECGDGHGRIADSERDAFYKAEYGRYKRLINIVDKFSTETAQSVSFMPNVWKKVNAHHLQSEFLPSPNLRGSDNGVRRGTLDSLVGDSDGNGEDETEDEEVEEEVDVDADVVAKPALQNQERAQETNNRADEEKASVDEDATDTPARPSPRKRMRQSTMFTTMGASSSNTTNARTGAELTVKAESRAVSNSKAMKPVDEFETEDLVCLVCQQNQRDGAIAHGNYLHFYSCYRCAKRQHAAKQGCMVCDRPIDNVLRILPLSKESRADILKQQT